MGGTDGRSTRAQVAMGRRVIQMPRSIHSSVILHPKYTKRRLNDFNIYAQVWMNLGLALRAQGRLSEAVDSLQRAAVLSEGTGTAAAPPSPAFLHYFEMGGEVSLMAEQTALDALTGLDSDESGRALRSAITPTASAGWRVIRVTCTAGSDAVGILSAVCRPLAALPLMNVSTLDANFLLVEGRHLEAALELLRQAGSTVARLL